MNMREIEAQAKALAPVFGRLLEQAKTALRDEFKAQLGERDQRIKELEGTIAAQVIPSAEEVAKLVDIAGLAKSAADLVPKPADGASADMDALKTHLDELVAALPSAEPGSSVTVDDVAPLIRDEIAKAVADIPKAMDGQSVTPEDVRPLLVELVGDAVKALPVPENGKDADMDVLRSHLGELVKSVQLPAVPTVDEVAGSFERRFSDLTLSWERQARDTFEKAADRMPLPKNGRDALPLESFDIALGDDLRTFTVKMQAGDVLLEKSVKIPALIDRDTYKPGAAYEKGDGVSYGGSFWIAKCDAPQGVPGSGETDWRCAVKKGRDGKDLRDSASKHDPSKGVPIK